MKRKAKTLRLGCFILCCLFGACFVVGCAEEAKPEPTQTKEERRLKEQEMMHREMQNK